MLTFKRLNPTTLLFSWPEPRTKKRVSEAKVSISEHISDKSINLLCEGFVAHTAKMANTSMNTEIQNFRIIMSFIIEENRRIPPPLSSEWQSFIIGHFAFVIEKTDFSQKTKEQIWQTTKAYYKRLKLRKVVPTNVVYPTAKINSKSHTPLNGRAFPVGHGIRKAPLPKNLKEVMKKDLLTDSTLTFDDEGYLESLASNLRFANSMIIEGCTEYWDKLLKIHQTGQDLLSKVSAEIFEHELKHGTFIRNGRHIAHPDQTEGMSWFLGGIKYYLTQTSELPSVSFKSLKEIEFFRPLVTNFDISKIISEKLNTLASQGFRRKLKIGESMNRLLGFLSMRDCAAACAILIKENPNFTSEGLQHANLLSVRDKPYVFTDNEGRYLLFGITKPRAAARKVTIFTSLCKKIFEDIIRCTSELRNKLKNNGDSNYRKLFLTSSGLWIGNPKIAQSMTAGADLSLYSEIEPHLAKAKIDRQDFSLSTIRVAQGMLRFLQTGSYYSVSLTLGNMPRTAHRHYIPEFLAEAWAIRRARLFTQKVVILATEGKPWQQESSDFSTSEDLIRVIRDIVKGATGDDALSYEIRRRLGHHVSGLEEILQPMTRKSLHISLDAKNLGAIYLYADSAESLEPAIRETIDPTTGITPNAFIDLAYLMRAASADPENSSHAEWSIRSHLHGGSHLQLKMIHQDALRFAESITAKVNSISVQMAHHIQGATNAKK